MNKNNNEAVWGIAAVIVIVLLTVAFWVGASAIEAATYSRVTGKKVTTLDAMFLDLRIQEPVKP